MPLQIIYGKAGSGKTTECFNKIEKIINENDGRILYLVPENYSLQTERQISKRYHDGLLTKIDVFSFRRLAQDVFSKVGPVIGEYIDNSAKQMLMQRAINTISNKLTSLSKASKKDDFAEIMVRTISGLKNHNITPDLLLNAAEKSENIALKLKLSDIYMIYERYNNNIVMPFCDADDNMALLCEKIKENNMFTDCHVIIDGFVNFPPDQMSVIKLLMQNAKSVTITLITDSLGTFDENYVFSRSVALSNMFFDIARECNIEVLPNIYKGKCFKYEENPELLHLEQNYFRYPHKVYEEKTENIELFCADNYNGEVSFAAKTIVRLCREKGYRFKDIALITKNTDVYLPLITNIFSSYDINFNISEDISVLQNGYIVSLLTVFDIIISNFSFESVFEWIKSDFCQVDPEAKYLLENYVLATGNSEKLWKNEKDWIFKGDFNDFDMKIINEAKTVAIAPILNFFKNFSGRKTVKEIVSAYSDFLNDINAKNIVLKRAKEFIDKQQIHKANLLVSSYNNFIKTINKFVLHMGDLQMSFDKFYKVLLSGISGCNAGQIPATIDQVQVTSTDKFSSSAKCVIILGVTDGVFPRGYINDGLLSDDDKAEIEKLGLPKLEDSFYLHNSENYKIYYSLTSAAEKLYLCYPTADNEGKALKPSIIVNRVKKIFPKIKQSTNIYKIDDISDIEGVIPTFNEYLMHEETPLWNAVLNWYKNNNKYIFDIANRAKSYTNLPLKLHKENVSLLYGDIINTSISKAERFAMCNFAYFMRYGLRVDLRKENKIQPSDAGSFMHEIIEKFSNYARSIGWDKINKDLCKIRCDEITGDVLNTYLSEAFKDSARNSYLFNKVKKIMSVTLWNITEYYQNSSFVPFGYELGFGTEDGYPPIEIDLDNGKKVNLTGKIDRADIWRTDNGAFLSIVDYKSGRKDIDYCQVLSGIQIQLPIYIDALCKSLANTDGVTPIPAAMHYYTIDSPMLSERGATDEAIEKHIKDALKMRGISLESERIDAGIGNAFLVKARASTTQLDKLIKTAHNQLKNSLTSIFSGSININPAVYSGKSSCDYCPYGSVCCFDTYLENNKYRYIKKLKREEFFEYADKVDNRSAKSN